MHTKRDGLIIVLIVAVLVAFGFVAYHGDFTIHMDFVNSMIAFHFFEFVLAIAFFIFVFRMSRTHSHHKARSFFSLNFLYMNLGMLLFVASAAWYLYTFISAGFGREFSPEMIHLVGSSGVVLSMLFVVKGMHKIYRDFIIKM